MFALLNRRALVPAVLAAGLAAAGARASGTAQENVPAANHQQYLTLTRGWARDAILTAAETRAMERGRARERQMTEGLDDPLASEILAAGEPSFERLAAAYPGKVLDRGVLGSYSDPHNGAASGDEFVIWWNGAISARLVKGPAENTNVLFRVGASAEMFGRAGERYSRVSYEDGYLPIVHATYVCDGIEYRETAFATDPGAGRARADVAYVQFELKNVGGTSRTAELHEDVILVDGSHATLAGSGLRDSTGALLVAVSGADTSFDGARQRLTQKVRLAPDAVAAVRLAIPYVPQAGDAVSAPAAADFQQAHDRIRQSSLALLGSAMQVDVPEQRVDDVWRALVLQNFILADGPRLTYGSGLVYNDSVYPFETGFAALTMARYGFADAAEAWLSYLVPASVEREKAGWRYQNRRAIPLHLLYQFYLLTGSTKYFDEHRDELFRVADEIIADRRTTMTDGSEPRPWHWGLLPRSRPAADAIASTQQNYVVAHDITNAQGLQDFGGFLVRSGIDTARGQRYLREAAGFRQCVLRAMAASVVRSPGRLPFVSLQTLYFRDTPDYGPEPYDNLALGRVQGTYEHYWADMEFRYDFFDPDDPLGHAIAEYVQRYGGFVLGVTRARPRAGQPYGWINGDYNAGYYEYALRRGDVPRFLLGLYSRLAFAASRHLYVASEGSPLIGYNTEDGGFVGAEYSFPNSSANAETLDMLRALLVREERERNVPTGVVDLAQATPRAWLADGQRIDVRRAPTEFGPLSFTIQSRTARGVISASIDPPRRAAFKELRLHLRHPRSLALRSVRVNGRPYRDFDAAQGSIALHPGPAHFAIEASYR